MRRKHPSGAVADRLVRRFGYAAVLTFVEDLRRAGFDRSPRLPAPRTLRAAAIRALPAQMDLGATAARLGLRPADLRRRLRRPHRVAA